MMLEYILIIFFPVFAFWYISVAIKRIERFARNFYLELRGRYPRNYVKPNAVVCFLRKFFKMDCNGTIHWIVSLMHYSQIVILATPIISLLMFLVFPANEAVGICLSIALIPFGMVCIIGQIFFATECHKCNKIKKGNPKHSKLKLQHEDIHL